METVTTTDPHEFIPCPRSAHLAQSTVNYTIHHAPRSEILANRGMCSACYEYVRRHHHAARNGIFEAPADLNKGHHCLNVDEDGAAVGAAGAEKVVWFNFDAVDGIEELADAPDDAKAHACELVRKIIAGLIGEQLTIVSLRGATAKLALLAAAIAPDKVPFNQIQLAALFGVTKQNLCKHSRDLQHRLGIKFFTGRSDTARQSMSRARKKNPVARNKSITPSAHPSPELKASGVMPKPSSCGTPSPAYM